MLDEASGRSKGDTIGLVTFDEDREWDASRFGDGGGEGVLAGTDVGGGCVATGGGVNVSVGGVEGSGSAMVCV
jgi:hypothetical protein